MSFIWFIICTVCYPQGWLLFLIAWLIHDCHREAGCRELHREIVLARLEDSK